MEIFFYCLGLKWNLKGISMYYFGKHLLVSENTPNHSHPILKDVIVLTSGILSKFKNCTLCDDTSVFSGLSWVNWRKRNIRLILI